MLPYNLVLERLISSQHNIVALVLSVSANKYMKLSLSVPFQNITENTVSCKYEHIIKNDKLELHCKVCCISTLPMPNPSIHYLYS